MTPWGQTLRSFSSSIIILSVACPHAVLDVVVDYEVEFFLGETIMLCEDTVDFVNNGLGILRIEFVVNNLACSLIMTFFTLFILFNQRKQMAVGRF